MTAYTGNKAAVRGLLYITLLALAAAALEWLIFQRLSLKGIFHWRPFVKHAALVAGLEGALIAGCLVVRTIERLARQRAVVSRVLAWLGIFTIVLGLSTLYTAYCASFIYVQQALNLTIIKQAIDALPEVRQSMPLTLYPIAAAYVVAILIAACVAWLLVQPVIAVCETLIDAFSLRSRAALAVAAGMTGLWLLGAYAWIDKTHRPTSWDGDTLSRAILLGNHGHLDITLTHSEQPLKPTSSPNVIVILSDSLRADHFSHYGYPRNTTPFLTELAKSPDFHKVDWATSTCPGTPCGVLGVLMSNTLSRVAGHGNVALHTFMGDAGYKIDLLLSGTHLENPVLEAVYGATSAFEVLSEGGLNKRGNDDQQILDLLDAMGPSGAQPHFMFIFLMSSHLTGKKYPQYRIFLPELPLLQAIRMASLSGPLSDQQLDAMTNAYDNGLLQMDDFIRQIFEKLDAKGYLKGSLVFFTGDHAEALGRHGEMAHGHVILPETLHVPMFIYDRSGRPYPSLPFASHTDIAATAVARLGLTKPPEWDGIDLAGSAAREWSFAENYLFDDEPCRGVYHLEGALYYLHVCKSGRSQVFNLSDDPAGLKNISATIDSKLLEMMRDRLKQRYPVFRNLDIWLQ